MPSTNTRSDQKRFKRVVVYVDPVHHERLKQMLARKGQTISSWFRLMVKTKLGYRRKRT